MYPIFMNHQPSFALYWFQHCGMTVNYKKAVRLKYCYSKEVSPEDVVSSRAAKTCLDLVSNVSSSCLVSPHSILARTYSSMNWVWPPRSYYTGNQWLNTNGIPININNKLWNYSTGDADAIRDLNTINMFHGFFATDVHPSQDSSITVTLYTEP